MKAEENYFNDSEEKLEQQEFENQEIERWSDKEVKILISLWEEFYNDLKQRKNLHIYQQIAVRLQEGLKKDRPYSAFDVRSKILTLKKHY